MLDPARCFTVESRRERDRERKREEVRRGERGDRRGRETPLQRCHTLLIVEEEVNLPL
jgi:hypothetical protein